ncbi:unnamed protein product [Ciceribacter sp. T2.26MG-112.2]|nr:unnamed protein product [Ciceribacter naphthalenivorans]
MWHLNVRDLRGSFFDSNLVWMIAGHQVFCFVVYSRLRH